MRVAPLGAYHADDPKRAALQAMASAEVTHAHPEGIIGAVVVVVAAAHAAAARFRGRPPAATFLTALDPYLVDGYVAHGIRRARRLLGKTVAEAAYELGNGSRVTAQDTVPFALWVAATRLEDYPAAVTACVEAGGRDIDTTAAIAGGIVAAYTGIGEPSRRAGRTPRLARRTRGPAYMGGARSLRGLIRHECSAWRNLAAHLSAAYPVANPPR